MKSKKSLLNDLSNFVKEIEELAKATNYQNFVVNRDVFCKIRSKVENYVRENVSEKDCSDLEYTRRGGYFLEHTDSVQELRQEHLEPFKAKLTALIQSIQSGHVQPEGVCVKVGRSLKNIFVYLSSDWRRLAVLLTFIAMLIFFQKIKDIKKIGPSEVEFFEK